MSVVSLLGCAPTEPAVAPLAPPPPPAPPPVAAPTTSAEPPKAAPKAVELSAEQHAKLYAELWAAFNTKDLAKYQSYLADNATSEMVDGGPALVGKDITEKGLKGFVSAFPDATGEAELTLVNGSTAVGVWLVRGTHKGTFATPHGELTPTGKKIGYLVGQVVEFQAGKVARELLYSDAHTFLGQLGAAPGPVRKLQEQGAAQKPVVIAAGSDAEKANVETYAKFIDGFNKHDSAALEPLLADAFVYSDQSAPADLVGKKEVQKGLKELWKGFSDIKLSTSSAWGAGDYVVSLGTLAGTNDGPVPSLKLFKKTGKSVSVGYLVVAKLEAGKLKQEWVFDNGLAFATQLGLTPPVKAAPPAKDAKPAPAAASKPEAPKDAPATSKAADAAKPAAAAAPAAEHAPGHHAPAAPAAPKTAPAAPAPAAPAAPKTAPAAPAPAAPAAPKTAPAAPAAPKTAPAAPKAAPSAAPAK